MSLHSDKITDAGVQYLEGLTRLRELDLACTGITDAGLERLKGLTRLERLDLFGAAGHRRRGGEAEAGAAELPDQPRHRPRSAAAARGVCPQSPPAAGEVAAFHIDNARAPPGP